MAATLSSAVLQEIRDTLVRLEEKADSKPMILDPLIAKALEALHESQGETNELLRSLNGCVREHSVALAGQNQWVADHAQVHMELAEKVKSIGMKAGIATAVGGAIAVLVGIAIRVLGG